MRFAEGAQTELSSPSPITRVGTPMTSDALQKHEVSTIDSNRTDADKLLPGLLMPNTRSGIQYGRWWCELGFLELP